MRSAIRLGGALFVGFGLLVPGGGDARPDADAGHRVEEGSVVSYDRAESLRELLPAPFWEHRRHYFGTDMALEIGPAHRDYAPPPVYQEATRSYRGRARIGPEGELLGYRAGQPFPVGEIDCKGDPQAGAKLIWNFVHRWEGFGAQATFRYTYWDRGEQLPLLYEGTTSAFFLKYRPEPQFAENDGDVFPNETRVVVAGLEVEKPSEMAGTRSLTYRYVDSLGAAEKPEDTWVWLRALRRVRKISEVNRSSAFSGTDFTFDDLFSFSGLPVQYEWRCLGRAEVLAPMNTQRLGFPYQRDGDFGPSGLSYASDRWEQRRAIQLEMVPKDPEHPYSRKVIWIDEQTFQPLYSFAWDRKGELWKIIHHNHRWSEDDLDGIPAREWYPAWEAVPEPRDLRVVSDSLLNVQTGTGDRLDFWDSRGTAPDPRSLRRYIDVRRLRQGR